MASAFLDYSYAQTDLLTSEDFSQPYQVLAGSQDIDFDRDIFSSFEARDYGTIPPLGVLEDGSLSTEWPSLPPPVLCDSSSPPSARTCINTYLPVMGYPPEEQGSNSTCPPRIGAEGSQPWEAESCAASDVSSVRVSYNARSDAQICHECQKIFSGPGELAQHARDSRHRTYICQEPGCEKSYYRRDTYVRHRSTHKPTSLHVCDICPPMSPARFKRSDHLKQHQRNCHPAFYEARERKARERKYQEPRYSPSGRPLAHPDGNRRLPTLPDFDRQRPGLSCPMKTLGRECCVDRVVPSRCPRQTMGDIAEALDGKLGDRHDEVLAIIEKQLVIHEKPAPAPSRDIAIEPRDPISVRGWLELAGDRAKPKWDLGPLPTILEDKMQLLMQSSR